MQHSDPATVVFLDIDGVLVLPRARGKPGRRCVRRLNQITDKTGAEIVISSTWRHMGLAKVRALFRAWGVTGRVRSMTPDPSKRKCQILSGDSRGSEIQAWLEQNPRVIRFVILDDGADMDHLSGHLVQTNSYEGLSAQSRDTALGLLVGSGERKE